MRSSCDYSLRSNDAAQSASQNADATVRSRSKIANHTAVVFSKQFREGVEHLPAPCSLMLQRHDRGNRLEAQSLWMSPRRKRARLSSRRAPSSGRTINFFRHAWPFEGKTCRILQPDTQDKATATEHPTAVRAASAQAETQLDSNRWRHGHARTDLCNSRHPQPAEIHQPESQATTHSQ